MLRNQRELCPGFVLQHMSIKFGSGVKDALEAEADPKSACNKDKAQSSRSFLVCALFGHQGSMLCSALHEAQAQCRYTQIPKYFAATMRCAYASLFVEHAFTDWNGC